MLDEEPWWLHWNSVWHARTMISPDAVIQIQNVPRNLSLVSNLNRSVFELTWKKIYHTHICLVRPDDVQLMSHGLPTT